MADKELERSYSLAFFKLGYYRQAMKSALDSLEIEDVEQAKCYLAESLDVHDEAFEAMMK